MPSAPIIMKRNYTKVLINKLNYDLLTMNGILLSLTSRQTLISWNAYTFEPTCKRTKIYLEPPYFSPLLHLFYIEEVCCLRWLHGTLAWLQLVQGWTSTKWASWPRILHILTNVEFIMFCSIFHRELLNFMFWKKETDTENRESGEKERNLMVYLLTFLHLFLLLYFFHGCIYELGKTFE